MRFSPPVVRSSLLAISVFLTVAAMPARAQLPSLSDVDRNAQAPATGPLPAWDVAVVKPHPPDDRNMSWQMTDDSVILKNLTLESLLCNAWDLKTYQLSGLSGWMSSKPFDLTAKVTDDDVAIYKKLNGAQRRKMLQTLLIDRFHLKLHDETKTLPVYSLVVAGGGPSLQPTTAIDAPSKEDFQAHPEKYRKGYMTMGPGRYEATGVPVRALTSQLANAVGKPVEDHTGLTGLYDITLHYRPDEGGTETDIPSVFSAVQEQLGLKLVPGKGPVELLVVDAAQLPDAD